MTWAAIVAGLIAAMPYILKLVLHLLENRHVPTSDEEMGGAVAAGDTAAITELLDGLPAGERLPADIRSSVSAAAGNIARGTVGPEDHD